jgi:anti-sigma factor (TIGR02949 family)
MEKTERLNCSDAVRQFFAYLDGALAGGPLEALEEHLEACLDCCQKLDFSRKLDTFVKNRLGEEPLPEGIEERIRRRIGNRGRKEG